MAIEAKLREPISLNFDRLPLSEAISFLQNYTGLNIVPDAGQVGNVIDLNAKISLQARGISLKTALKLMLRPLGLYYRIEDEVLLITNTLTTPAQAPSLREFEAKLGVAVRRYQRVKALFKSGMVPRSDFDEAIDEVQLLVGQLQGLKERVEGDASQYQVDRVRKQAGLQVSQAERELAASLVARNQRLNQRKPGSVSSDEINRAEGESKVAQAEIEVRKAELAAVDLMIKQAWRRDQSIAALLALATKSVPELQSRSGPNVNENSSSVLEELPTSRPVVDDASPFRTKGDAPSRGAAGGAAPEQGVSLEPF